MSAAITGFSAGSRKLGHGADAARPERTRPERTHHAPTAAADRTQEADERRSADAIDRGADEATSEDQERDRRFADWMQAETAPVFKAKAPRRAPPPDEDPMALLAELQPPAWLTPGELSGAAGALPASTGLPPNATPRGASPGAASGQAHVASGESVNPATRAEPPMFEVEVEYEPPPALREPAGLRQLTPGPQAAPTAAIADPGNAGAPAELTAEAKPAAPQAAALAPEVTAREYVPVLKQVRVTIDKSLALEVSPSDGDGVSVRLDGTAEALRSMADIEGELRDELNQSGHQLDDFESQEREGEAGADEASGSAGDASNGDADEASTGGRKVLHDGLVSTIA